eukprot:2972436-Pyramimonas_sp.AAC.1
MGTESLRGVIHAFAQRNGQGRRRQHERRAGGTLQPGWFIFDRLAPSQTIRRGAPQCESRSHSFHCTYE